MFSLYFVFWHNSLFIEFNILHTFPSERMFKEDQTAQRDEIRYPLSRISYIEWWTNFIKMCRDSLEESPHYAGWCLMV